MIKIEIVGEEPKADKTVKLQFRRGVHPADPETAFLVAKGAGAQGSDLFPVRIDGPKAKFFVRKRALEALGFELVVEE